MTLLYKRERPKEGEDEADGKLTRGATRPERIAKAGSSTRLEKGEWNIFDLGRDRTNIVSEDRKL